MSRLSRLAPDRVATAAACLAATALGCGELPPRGEVVVVVDTDLPAPALASRLQVDVYTPDGAWYLSQSLARPNASDWPLSFGVRSPEDHPDTELLLRLRVHPEGKVRGYIGERFLPPVDFVPPRAPTNPDELCTGATKLELGSSVRLRRGFLPVVDTRCTPMPATSGATAAYVDIVEPGTYRFAVTEATIGEPLGFDSEPHATLDVRSDCALARSAVACDDGLAPTRGRGDVSPYRKPDVTVDLAPGRWFVITSGTWPGGPSDVVVAAAHASAFGAVTPPPSNEPPAELVLEKWLRDDPTGTPEREPQPDLTVDRLVRLRVPPERTSSASVILRGACMGTPARLPSDGAAAETCVDAEGVLGPVLVEALAEGAPADPLPASLAGTMMAEAPCLPGDSTPEVVCIPGGWFILGGVEGGGFGAGSSVPERLATLPRFWIDRHEVTRGRYQAAVAAGFAEPPVLTTGSWLDCPSTDTMQDVDMAQTCTSWYAAEAFCKFADGQLPLEAEWEYVASAAGRSEETPWPWGASAPVCACGAEDPGCNCAGRGPDCHFAVIGRDVIPGQPGHCVEDGDPTTLGALPVLAAGGPHGDVTPLGVVGLAGGVTEMMRDAYHPYDGACWRATKMASRVCLEDFALLNAYRGSSWQGTSAVSAAAIRVGSSPPAFAGSPGLGFRCVYAQAPGARAGQR